MTMPVNQAPALHSGSRLAELEHERTALATELERVRTQVREQRRQLRLVLDREERQRGDLALELHEAAAQSLAGVLLGLELLGSPNRPEVAALQAEVTATLGDLRRLATNLRPAVLDQLGLGPALERLATNAGHDHQGSVTIVGAELSRRLPPEIETLVYRVVEEALDRLSPPMTVVLDDAGAGELDVTVTGWPRRGDRDPAGFAAIRARLELAGGSLALDTDADVVMVCARLPVPAEAVACHG
jgi:signal transduction histidine kinase